MGESQLKKNKEARSYYLRDYEAVSWKRENFIFSILFESVWFIFCFRWNIYARFEITLFKACVH